MDLSVTRIPRLTNLKKKLDILSLYGTLSNGNIPDRCLILYPLMLSKGHAKKNYVPNRISLHFLFELM